MLELIKRRCGIAESITVYDEDILVYIKDCMGDMVSSVCQSILQNQKNRKAY